MPPMWALISCRYWFKRARLSPVLFLDLTKIWCFKQTVVICSSIILECRVFCVHVLNTCIFTLILIYFVFFRRVYCWLCYWPDWLWLVSNQDLCHDWSLLGKHTTNIISKTVTLGGTRAFAGSVAAQKTSFVTFLISVGRLKLGTKIPWTTIMTSAKVRISKYNFY